MGMKILVFLTFALSYKGNLRQELPVQFDFYDAIIYFVYLKLHETGGHARL